MESQIKKNKTISPSKNFRDVPSLTQSLDKEHYLYDRLGPWPQPSPNHPLGEAPAVVHLPKKEEKRFKVISFRYIKNLLTYWPSALLYAWKNPHAKEVNDEEFDRFLTVETFSKFLNKNFDEFKRGIFDEFFIKYPDTTFYVTDLTLAQYITPTDELYTAPTMTLIQEMPNGDKKAVAIYMNDSDLLLKPEDGNAWELAKYYVLMGATYKIVLSEHALLHFPFDCINAITKTALPKSSLLFKLLYPHLEFQLVLNDSVLNSSNSPIHNNMPLYDAFTGDSEGLRDLIVAGYKGIKNDSCYPSFEWTLEPKKVYSDYGVFLDEYYNTILEFTSNVLKKVTDDEFKHIKLWAKYISQWLPEFPDEEEIENIDTLNKSVAKIIWDLSVGHAADHYSYSMLPINQLPLRLRVAPPSSKEVPSFEQKDLMKWYDIFKYRMVRKMFFKPTNVTLLKDTKYDFDDGELNALSSKFLQNLRDTENKIVNELKIKNYIPLDEISRSIQY